jgi:hypothetical protein
MHHRGPDHRTVDPRGSGANIVKGQVSRESGGTFGAQ